MCPHVRWLVAWLIGRLVGWLVGLFVIVSEKGRTGSYTSMLVSDNIFVGLELAI